MTWCTVQWTERVFGRCAILDEFNQWHVPRIALRDALQWISWYTSRRCEPSGSPAPESPWQPVGGRRFPININRWRKKKKTSPNVHLISPTTYSWKICCKALTPECLRHVSGHQFHLLRPDEPVIEHGSVTGAWGQKNTKLNTKTTRLCPNSLEYTFIKYLLRHFMDKYANKCFCCMCREQQPDFIQFLSKSVAASGALERRNGSIPT